MMYLSVSRKDLDDIRSFVKDTIEADEQWIGVDGEEDNDVRYLKKDKKRMCALLKRINRLSDAR